MAKKRKLAAEKVAGGGGMKQVARKHSENAFELKFNRQKHQVLGQVAKRSKKSKALAVGRPAASKKRALELREQSLFQEFSQLGKSNKFVDRRIGERDQNLTTDERAARRFTAELKGRFASTRKNRLVYLRTCFLSHRVEWIVLAARREVV